MAKLKVFRGNHDGKNYRLVACSSQAKAAELLNLRPAQFKKHYRVIDHPADSALALAHPDTVFIKPIQYSPDATAEWTEA